MLLYYITDRTQFGGAEHARTRTLLQKISEAARCGVNLIQLREKDLSARQLEDLGREAVHCAKEASGGRTRLLINSRVDVAIAIGADGVHLPAGNLTPSQVREIWKRACPSSELPIVGVSCHTTSDAIHAAIERATFAVFAPVFEKKDTPGATRTGLTGLRAACHEGIPVLALGGVTLENTKSCLDQGAAGIAAIRLFQDNDIAEVVQTLRGKQV